MPGRMSDGAEQARKRNGFDREADMLELLRAGRSVTTCGEAGDLVWSTLFEVPALYGVVDVLHVAYDARAMAKRTEQLPPPVTDWYELAVFDALWRVGERGLLLEDLAQRTGLSVAGVRRGSLARLVSKGHVKQINDRRYCSTWQYCNPVRALIAIEAKRRDWRRALSQAFRYTSFADRTFVALERDVAVRAARYTELLASSGVGVIAVNPAPPEIDRTVDAPLLRDRVKSLERAYVAEQVVQLFRTGSVSGPVSPVFGRFHTTSKGPDPRTAVAK